MASIESVLAGAQALANGVIPLVASGLSMCAGVWIIYSVIYQVYKKGSASHGVAAGQDITWGGIGWRLAVGGLLLRFGATMQDLSLVVIGTEIEDHRGVLAYVPLGNTGFGSQVWEVCLLWMVMMGWAAGFRGLLQWNTAASGGGGSGGSGGDYMWRGFWHLLGGVLMINVSGAIKAFLGS